MPALLYHTPVAVHQIKFQPTELGTFPTVRTASETMLRHIALAAVTDAKRPMDKHLQRHVASLMHGPNLPQRQLAGQHHLAESQTFKEKRFLRRAVVHLRAGM